MKKIGFIDYYISEWHANNYPAWIEEINKKSGEDFVVAYAWAELDVSPVDGRTTDQWCEAFKVERCGSIAELCQMCDYILILAPSDPDKHLAYAKEALKFGKNTYIDKTFAPDYATAKKIYEIAEKQGTKIFSSSALRYADALNDYNGNAKNVLTTGGGRTLDEYIVHQIEMVVKAMGVGAEKVLVTTEEDRHYCKIAYGDGRMATLFFAPMLDFAAYITGEDGVTNLHPVQSGFFKTLIEEILRFLASGKAPFPKEQTLEVMKIREGILKAAQKAGVWQKL